MWWSSLIIYFLSNYLQNRLVTILGEQLLESWKFDKKIQTGDIETKKNKDTNSLKLKSMALFGATPSQDMQLSRFASELASGKIPTAHYAKVQKYNRAK